MQCTNLHEPELKKVTKKELGGRKSIQFRKDSSSSIKNTRADSVTYSKYLNLKTQRKSFKNIHANRST